MSPRAQAGIRRRHSRRCPAHRNDDLAVCECSPTYQVQAGSRHDRRTKTFATLRDARRWRSEQNARTEWRGRRRCPTLREATEGWLEEIASGRVTSRHGGPYRARTIAGYRRSMRGRVLPLGNRRLDDITRGDVRALVAQLLADGLKPRTAKNVLTALQAVYGWAIDHGYTRMRPAEKVVVPGSSLSRRDRWADADEVRSLLDALPDADRALWATAVYAGLRRGEIMGLTWGAVDLSRGELRIEQAYDPTTRAMTDVKSLAGRRVVPISASLHDYLSAHRLRSGLGAAERLVFSRASLGSKVRDNITVRHHPGCGHRAGECVCTPSFRVQVWDRARQRQIRRQFTDRAAAEAWRDRIRVEVAARDSRHPSRVPFSDTAIIKRAERAWERAALRPINLHAARHSYGSMMIAAGVRPDVVAELMGHDSPDVTMRLYVHRSGGQRRHAAELLDRHVAGGRPDAGEVGTRS